MKAIDRIQIRRNPWHQVLIPVTFSTMVLTPFITFLLLAMKGFPDFASDRVGVILLWCYETTGVIGFLSGLMISGLYLLMRPRWGWWIWPYDLGRSLSVGAVSGALSQIVATVLFRFVIGRPFSTFWISGAILSGAISGSIIAAIYFWRRSNDPVIKD